MRCPFCEYQETKVIDSRFVGEGEQVRRRRECLSCNERFTTYETAELTFPHIIKRDGTRGSFNEDKMRGGMLIALEKRPVSIEDIESAISRLKHRLRASGEREVKSQELGNWVMEELLALDEVAYVRFASVYHSFQDLEAFRLEIQRLRKKTHTDNKKEVSE